MSLATRSWSFIALRQMFPATLRNDRLRVRVKWLLKNSEDTEAFVLVQAASISRAASIRGQIEADTWKMRLEFYDRKEQQDIDLKRIYLAAWYDLREELTHAGPRINQRALLADLTRRLRALGVDTEAYTLASMGTAAGMGQSAMYGPLAGVLPPSAAPFPLSVSIAFDRVNERAVRIVVARDFGKIPLSRRIWRHMEAARDGIRHALARGVARGASTDDMAREMREFMIGPFQEGNTAADGYRMQARRYREQARKAYAHAEQLRRDALVAVDAGRAGEADRMARYAIEVDGKATILAKQARDAFALAADSEKGYGGRGVYRSWWKNARRMVREESNRAYREGFLQGAKPYQNMVLHQWTLSAGHPKPDICDSLATQSEGHGPGVYDVMSYPVTPHIGCLCYDTPVVVWGNVYPGSLEAS